MRIKLYKLQEKSYRILKEDFTNVYGRTNEPLVNQGQLSIGKYKIEFYVSDYFKSLHIKVDDPPFFEIVPIYIGIADGNIKYHIPLLCSPWSYTTYRGS